MTTIRLRLTTIRRGHCAAASCRAPLEWYRTLAGKAMPMNLGATVVALERDEHGAIGVFDAAESHWATCPARARFTRPRPRR